MAVSSSPPYSVSSILTCLQASIDMITETISYFVLVMGATPDVFVHVQAAELHAMSTTMRRTEAFDNGGPRRFALLRCHVYRDRGWSVAVLPTDCFELSWLIPLPLLLVVAVLSAWVFRMTHASQRYVYYRCSGCGRQSACVILCYIHRCCSDK